jgi:hypothetical protein
MNRRDFLSLHTGSRGRTVEVSCERLYLLCLDADISSEGHEAHEHDVWEGEPAPVRDRRTPADVFERLGRELAEADAVKVFDRNWMAGGDLNERFEALLASFRARGGRVEFSVSSPS